MPLSNINVDRVLSTKEVREMLVDDCWEFDSHIKSLNNRWSALIGSATWKKQPIPENFARVTAWKEYSKYYLRSENGHNSVYEKLFFACWLVKTPSKTGLCIEDFEILVCKMEFEHVVRVLLDAGFVLNLVISKTYLTE